MRAIIIFRKLRIRMSYFSLTIFEILSSNYYHIISFVVYSKVALWQHYDANLENCNMVSIKQQTPRKRL